MIRNENIISKEHKTKNLASIVSYKPSKLEGQSKLEEPLRGVSFFTTRGVPGIGEHKNFGNQKGETEEFLVLFWGGTKESYRSY